MFTRLFSTAAASLLFVGLAACAADMDQPESSDGATASASETLPIDPRVDKFKTACESCKGCSVFTTQDNGCTVYHCGCDSTAGAVCASKAVDSALSASMETVGTGGAGGSGTKFQNSAIVASNLGAVLESGSGSAGAGETVSHGIEQIVFARTRSLFIVVEKWQFSARRMTNFECPLIKVSRTWPESIGTRAVTGSIDAVTPDTFGKIHTLSRFNHVCGRGGG